MSRAAKQSLFILGVLLLASFSFLGATLFQKKTLEQDKASLARQVEDYQLRETRYLSENKTLQEKLKAVETAKTELEEKLSKVSSSAGDFDAKINELTTQRDELQKKSAELQKQKDELTAKLAAKPEPQVVIKYVEKSADGNSTEVAGATPTSSRGDSVSPSLAATANDPSGETAAATVGSFPSGAPSEDQPEEYWAKVLKEKAALELELEKVKQTLTRKSLEIVELNKLNSDLQLALGSLKEAKESIENDIKKGNDLADTLSLALARAENEKKFLNERITKTNVDNEELRGQIKELTSTKIALEKSIVRLQDEKKEITRKLVESENIIQSRVDEVWKIKENLNKNLKISDPSPAGAVELSPIVISPSGEESVTPSSISPPGAALPARNVGVQGAVVSVNDENNFVIVDIGSEKGLKVGDNLSVYRGVEYVAGLEIIQVRKDISAADIKNKVSAIQIGDAVR